MNFLHKNIDWLWVAFAAIYILAIGVLFYTIGKEQGEKTSRYLCPPVQQGQELLSSTILLDDEEKPIALTCSYVEPMQRKGRVITRKTNKLS